MDQDPPCDESASGKPEDDQAFFMKATMLINRLMHEDGIVTALHALILLMSFYRQSSRRVGPDKGYLSTAHRTITRLVRALVEDEIPEFARVGAECLTHPNDHENHLGEIEYEGLSWRSAPKDHRNLYWNFAEPARLLRLAYFDKDLSHRECESPSYRPYEDECFHGVCLDTLNWLQIKAWSEIRTSAFLIAEPKLPAEIVESIFEYALLFEDIPSDPATDETVMARYKRTKAPARPILCIKDLYRCPNIPLPNMQIVSRSTDLVDERLNDGSSEQNHEVSRGVSD